MNRMIKVLLCTTMIALSACSSHRVAHYEICSTREFNISQGARYLPGKGQVQGIDKTHVFLIFPFRRKRMDKAVEDAISKQVGCVALTDVVVYSRSWRIPFIYGQDAYVVFGTPLLDHSYLNEIKPLIKKD